MLLAQVSHERQSSASKLKLSSVLGHGVSGSATWKIGSSKVADPEMEVEYASTLSEGRSVAATLNPKDGSGDIERSTSTRRPSTRRSPRRWTWAASPSWPSSAAGPSEPFDVPNESRYYAREGNAAGGARAMLCGCVCGCEHVCVSQCVCARAVCRERGACIRCIVTQGTLRDV